MHHRGQSIGDMVCRRASIPAATEAAAVASWPLGPLAVALAVLSAMPHVALSRSLALPPLPSPLQMNLTCKDVPFPFGERGASSLPGFVVICGPNNETMLRIGEHMYEIDEVSVPESSITIRAGPIKQVCYDRSGRPKQITGIDPGPTSLEATPFTFSKRNILVATGCNYRFFANFTSSSGGGDGTPTSCATYCTGSSETIFNGSCAELACCKASMQMDGAQEFALTFDKPWPSGKVSGEEASTCSAVFFLDQDEQVFTGAGDGRKMSLKDALVPLGYRRMVLDWAIPGNCEQILAPQYQCGSMSTCNDVYNGTGYICRCNEGYEGNPYEQNGCSDVNECRDINNNNCSIGACQNTDGGFTCSCPKDTVGDGYRAGTGCSIDSLPPFGNMSRIFGPESYLSWNFCSEPY